MARLLFALFVAGTAAFQEESRLVAIIPEGVDAGYVTFSSDGKVAAYCAGNDNRFWIVRGDWKSKAYGLPSFPVLRNDGKDVFYGIPTEGHTVLVYRNDFVLYETGDIREWGWSVPGVISADGKVQVSQVQNLKSGQWGVAINGKIQKLHKGLSSPPVVISEDGKAFAFALQNDDGHCIVVNDKPGPTFDWVTTPALSADGKVVAYGAETEKGFLLIQGEKKTPIPASPKGILLSSDGKSIGYWKSEKKKDQKKSERVIMGEKEGPEFASVMQPVFSPDGKHVTYRAKKDDGKWVVVIDDRTVPVGDIQTNPIFVQDGAKVGYGDRQGRELHWKTLKVE